jgi:hypothetical protein
MIKYSLLEEFRSPFGIIKRACFVRSESVIEISLLGNHNKIILIVRAVASTVAKEAT